MYAGHFAAALALKSVKPETPTWALMTATGLLDLLYAPLVAVGIEGAMPDYATSHRLYAPWSHSLASAVLLAGLFALFFRRRGHGVVLVLFAAVFSHWLLDLLVHRPDLPLWPGSATMLGFNELFGPVSGAGETILTIAATAFYAVRAHQSPLYGRHWPGICAVIALTWGMAHLAAS